MHAVRDKSALLFDLLDTSSAESGEPSVRLTDDFARASRCGAAACAVALEDALGEIELLADGLQLVRERLESCERASTKAVMPLLERDARRRRAGCRWPATGLRRALDPPPGEPAVRWIEARGRDERAVSVSTVPARPRAHPSRGSVQARRRRRSSRARRSPPIGKFDFLTARLGLDDPELEPRTGIYPSPFQYREQAHPRRAERRPAAERRSRRPLRAVARIDDRSRRGRERRHVRAVHQPQGRARHGAELRARGVERRWPLLVHGDETRDALLSRFRDAGQAILLGTASFWEGVDVPGDALRALLIAKLPFRVPTEPITAAHCEAIAAAAAILSGVHAAARRASTQAGLWPADPHERRSRRRGHRRPACRHQGVRTRLLDGLPPPREYRW